MSGTKNLLKRIMGSNLSAIVGFAALLCSTSPALAQAVLGTAQSFAVLGGSTVTNTGPTIVTGDLGVEPGSAVTNFPPGIVLGGTIHANDAVALSAQNDNTTAYNILAGQACDFDLTGQDLGGLTLTQGVYCFSSSAQLTGALTLDAQGDLDAVWVFQIGTTLTTASNASVLVINGAQPCNVFWQVGSSATLGTTTSFIGNILALTSITLTTGANVSGRALAQNGAVTMDSNHVAISVCAVPPVGPIPPTLGKAFSPATINEQGTPIDISTLTITLSNADAAAATLTAPFIDTLPGGVTTVAGSQGTTCVGGTGATATASTVTLALGASIPAGGSCTVTVNVTAASAGTYINTLGIGALVTSNGNNAAPAVATLVVNPVTPPQPPFVTLAKAFSPATINEQGTPIDTSTLTITLSNPNSTVANLTAPLIDTLPIGVVVANPANAANNCGGTFTAIPGALTVTLSAGASIPANGSCAVTVDVTAPVASSYFNTLAAGALQTTNGSNAAAVATLTVLPVITVQPPTISKSFNPTSIGPGGVSLLTITVTNPNPSSVATAAFTDTLPTSPGQMSVAAGSQTNTCGGTLSAATGAFAVILSGGSIPAGGFCTVKVNVTASIQGTYTNHLGAASATLQVSQSVVTCKEDPNRAALLTRTVNLSKPNLSGSGVTGDPKNYWLVQAAYNAAKASGQSEVIGLFANTNENLLLDGSKSLTITQCTVARVTGAAGSPVWNITSTGKLTIIGPDSVGGSIGWRVAGNGGHNLKSVRANGASVDGILITSSNNSVSWNDVGGNGNGTATAAGIRVEGGSNTLKGGTVGSNNGDGVQLIGNSNTLSGSNILSNTGNGVLVTGSTNTVKSNGRINLNGKNGILVAGSGSGNTLSSNASESGKGNTLSGINVTGNTNQLTDNKMNSNGVGFSISGTGNKLKSNATSNNTGNEYTIGASNVDQTGNKKNGSSFSFGAGGGNFN